MCKSNTINRKTFDPDTQLERHSFSSVVRGKCPRSSWYCSVAQRGSGPRSRSYASPALLHRFCGGCGVARPLPDGRCSAAPRFSFAPAQLFRASVCKRTLPALDEQVTDVSSASGSISQRNALKEVGVSSCRHSILLSCLGCDSSSTNPSGINRLGNS